jgi:hypothetical protein
MLYFSLPPKILFECASARHTILSAHAVRRQQRIGTTNPSKKLYCLKNDGGRSSAHVGVWDDKPKAAATIVLSFDARSINGCHPICCRIQAGRKDWKGGVSLLMLILHSMIACRGRWKRPTCTSTRIPRPTLSRPTSPVSCFVF